MTTPQFRDLNRFSATFQLQIPCLLTIAFEREVQRDVDNEDLAPDMARNLRLTFSTVNENCFHS